jgi:polysaccharide pyruvyl transferase WcaK-like protein
MPSKCIACIDGSFGKGNLGDTALLNCFLDEHQTDFDKLFVISSKGFGAERSDNEMVLEPPPLCSGWRKYKGWGQKLATRQRWLRAVGREATHVCLGGLLVGDIFVDLRTQMFAMTRGIGWRPSYYFGDFSVVCRPTRDLKKLFRLWEDTDAWVGVRAQEAANLMHERGFRREVHVGVDPVLFARSKEFDLPSSRRRKVGAIAALVPSFRATGDSATKAWWCNAVREVRLKGLQVRWCIFDEMFDVGPARELSALCGDSEAQFQESLCFGKAAIHAVEVATICFTERYHGAIFPITAGVPTVAHGWNEKIRRLFQRLELHDWCVDDLADEERCKKDQQALVRRAFDNQWFPNFERLKADLDGHAAALKSFREWFRNG